MSDEHHNLPINEHAYRRAEILTVPERRRHWSDEDKARIVAESLAPNAISRVVARRHGVPFPLEPLNLHVDIYTSAARLSQFARWLNMFGKTPKRQNRPISHSHQ